MVGTCKTPNCKNEKDNFFGNNVDGDANDSSEARNSFVGTEAYVAPEVINNQEASYFADLWSLGVIIYQIFTGKTPFKAST